VNDDVGSVRAGRLIGRTAYDRAGNRLGTIADLIVDGDLENGLRVTKVVIARRPWGRLLGYERVQVTGPWLIHALARTVIHRRVRTIDWHELDHSR
jgi:PRC-barrel domain